MSARDTDPMHLRAWAGPLGVAAAHFALAYPSLQLSLWSSDLTAVWPASAVLLAALLVARPSRAWAYVAIFWPVSTIANMLAGSTMPIASIFATANVITCLVPAALLRRCGISAPNLESTHHLLRFGLASVIGSAASACISAIALCGLLGAPLVESWLIWFGSNSIGLLVVTPALLIVRDAVRRRQITPGFTDHRYAAALVVLIVACSIAVFTHARYPLLFALPPLVTLATFRLRCIGAVVATIVVAVVGAWSTAAGVGPFATFAGTTAEKIFLMQIFLAATFLSALPVAAVLGERDALASAALANASNAETMASEARRIAATDELTGVASRRKLLACLEDEVRISAVGGRPLALALIDVDHFKQINDRFGHAVGDAVLVRLAQITTHAVRSDDVVGRLGGEEFAVIMPGATLDQARTVAERVRLAAVGAQADGGADLPPVTISIGVTEMVPGATGADLLKAADEAMYRAKARGRNRLEFV